MAAGSCVCLSINQDRELAGMDLARQGQSDQGSVAGWICPALVPFFSSVSKSCVILGEPLFVFLDAGRGECD